MSWWLVALIGWVIAIPVVTLICAAVLRGGRLDDEARLEALARRRGDGGSGVPAGAGSGAGSRTRSLRQVS